MKNKLSLNWSLLDQAAVSAINFLTIFLGAYFLEVGEQAKLAFFYVILIAATLFNAAFYFASVPFLKNKFGANSNYLAALRYLSLRLMLPVAFLISVASLFTSKLSNWDMSWIDFSLVFLNLALFLYFEFYRRSQYFFGSTLYAAKSSILIGVARLLLIVVFSPESINQFLTITVISYLVVVFPTWNKSDKKSDVDFNLIRQHIVYSKWSISNIVPQWIAIHSPVVLAGFFVEAKVIAILLTLRSVTSVFNVVLELFDTYLSSKLGKLMANGESMMPYRFLKKIYAAEILLGIVIGVLIYIYGEAVLKASIGIEYSKHWFLLMLFWIGNVLYFVGRLSAISLRVKGGPLYEFMGSLVGSFVVMALMLLIDSFSIYSFAVVLIFSQLALVLTQLLIPLAYPTKYYEQ